MAAAAAVPDRRKACGNAETWPVLANSDAAINGLQKRNTEVRQSRIRVDLELRADKDKQRKACACHGRRVVNLEEVAHVRQVRHRHRCDTRAAVHIKEPRHVHQIQRRNTAKRKCICSSASTLVPVAAENDVSGHVAMRHGGLVERIAHERVARRGCCRSR